jgi:hypothetical protein
MTTFYKAANMSSDYDYVENDDNQPQATVSADMLGIVGVGQVKNQAFVEIVDLNNRYHLYTYFMLMKSSGVFGLAYPSASTNGITTVLQNMIQQNLISSPMFSLSFSKTKY